MGDAQTTGRGGPGEGILRSRCAGCLDARCACCLVVAIAPDRRCDPEKVRPKGKEAQQRSDPQADPCSCVRWLCLLCLELLFIEEASELRSQARSHCQCCFDSRVQLQTRDRDGFSYIQSGCRPRLLRSHRHRQCSVAHRIGSRHTKQSDSHSDNSSHTMNMQAASASRARILDVAQRF